jgi:Ser/Thr protein kinase RdoA (MazF antagonist)
MKKTILDALKTAYELDADNLLAKRFGSGHIHKTYKVDSSSRSFILQEFNDTVFKYPDRISNNLSYLLDNFDPANLPFVLPLPIPNRNGNLFTELDGGLYRLFPFVSGVTRDDIDQKEQASRAAEAFAYFVRVFLPTNAERLQDTIQDFHHLGWRYEQFEQALKSPAIEVDKQTLDMIAYYQARRELLEKYSDYSSRLPLRTTHNDTKINNLIFSDNLSQVNALIDLDTIMAGFVFYDFGDLARTVACTKDESSLDWDEIGVDTAKYEGLLEGFYSVLAGQISHEELASLPFGAEMMTLIMGLRFLTDHLNGNIYYQVEYEEQNLHRSKNQAALLSAFIEKRPAIQKLEIRLKEKYSV